ncbi:type II toxin-antitoxin system RelE family toxin [Methanocaldococcus vulcanius]|uniref:type II toxin-antitoxin system RelE family toxin n=1 Tax=Methanocaldococcus vulcanius TaxID=73913 RepID=UPI0001B0D995|nr:hypothetical protein [Methanocaldococcus vulcanius]
MTNKKQFAVQIWTAQTSNGERIFSIKFHKNAVKSAKYLPNSHKKKLEEFLNNVLRHNPIQLKGFNIKKLTGKHPPLYRLRLGDFG